MSIEKVTIEKGIAFFEDGTEVSNVSLNLIALSPEMLEHLKWVQSSLNKGEDPDLIIAETANLISKIE